MNLIKEKIMAASKTPVTDTNKGSEPMDEAKKQF